MFQRILIANRGEIAVRIIHTLQKMGVDSVAVYSEADWASLHVSRADQAVCVGPPPVAQSYLNAQAILKAAKENGAQAIHPGYGFFSENPDFARQCETAGLVFIGPTPEQMEMFGLKHKARQLALENHVPLLPGSGLLADVEEALVEVRRIGFPVMLKSTAGGGGIGMRLCWNETELRESFETVGRLSKANFSQGGMYLEKFIQSARHLEVQVFGDGDGHIITLGERDCSVQRRNQKVMEETPAPGLSPFLRAELIQVAQRLMEAVSYRGAGTVEFVYDTHQQAFYFLEVNTRLQVEHGVTEAVTGLDLVEWQIRLAAGDRGMFNQPPPVAKGHAIQARVYAESPLRQFQPTGGLITEWKPPQNTRVDTWIEAGVEVSGFYDPLVAKLIVWGQDRSQALQKMGLALTHTSIGGVETNLSYLTAILQHPAYQHGQQITSLLKDMPFHPQVAEVLEPGVQTTVQDWPGRLGYWDVGVPPSGPMDNLAFRLANALLGNPDWMAALEMTLTGPTLRFHVSVVIALTGADFGATLDGRPLACWHAHVIPAGGVVRFGEVQGGGTRGYLAVKGGFKVPLYLGSAATFTMGRFGGHGGRPLRTGDMLTVSTTPQMTENDVVTTASLPVELIPTYGSTWEIGVLDGPHGAPDFFTTQDIEMLYDTDWEVHFNSNRTGVRLIGPKPQWARQDGGEAGLHPSNLHDNAYAVGAVDFTGDMPVILGPDGPSLGGFVCPVTVVEAELWKLGQLRPGNKVRFRSLSVEQAHEQMLNQDQLITQQGKSSSLSPFLPAPPWRLPSNISQPGQVTSPILGHISPPDAPLQVVYRQSGCANVLVEYGPPTLDLVSRVRVHALWQQLTHHTLPGVIDLTPGIRSLQVHFDPRQISQNTILEHLRRAEESLGDLSQFEVDIRVVHLPLAWNDSQTRLAIERYQTGVRPDAPWCPSNIEFIRRINGLDNEQAVKDIVYGASYLVMGLGDVYLGAPVATPLDPRHRLVTTKYNPARTWTPENAVGIGGAYLCIYGMEGPGGYQFVGRTLPVWNRFGQNTMFEPGKPWLLRFFDIIRFFPVTEAELLTIREAFPLGRYPLRIEKDVFRLSDYQRLLRDNAQEISAFKEKQQTAFLAERQRWGAEEHTTSLTDAMVANAQGDAELDLQPGARWAVSPVSGSVWKVFVEEGQQVEAGQTLVILESMKMEFHIQSPQAGVISHLFCQVGGMVTAGQNLMVVQGESQS